MAAKDWGTDHIDGELGSDTAVTSDVFAPMSLPLFHGSRRTSVVCVVTSLSFMVSLQGWKSDQVASFPHIAR